MSPRHRFPLALSLVFLTGCASLPPPSQLPPCVGIDVSSVTFDVSPNVLPRAESYLGRDIWLLQPESPDGVNVERVDSSDVDAPSTTLIRPLPFLRFFRPLFVSYGTTLHVPGDSWEAARACSRAGVSECTIPAATYRIRLRYLARHEDRRVLCECVSRSFRVEHDTHLVIMN